jgi:16S rRNA (cytosine967-C5)-methyltransferase
MIDSAFLNHAARILGLVADGRRADAAMRAYFAGHRRLGAREKRVVSGLIFSYFRWLQWLDPKLSLQKRLEQADALRERFLADPRSVKPEALAARAVPSWLAGEMDLTADFLVQLQREPALWIRGRPGCRDQLAKSLAACEPAASAPDALRFTGTQDLFRTEEFRAGEFEIQDLSSQLVGIAADPKPGETWWDACAGEGGKTLHLAALMGNKGLIWATDRHAGRLAVLKRRAARAKLFNYRAALWDGSARLPTKTAFDGILVDAPCSGVGAWQRNPQARWTTTPDDVRELAAAQLSLLSRAAGSLKPGGRLIYAVCTLTSRETAAVADAFARAHPELRPEPLAIAPAGAADRSRVVLWPQRINAGGMFVAGWRKPRLV